MVFILMTLMQKTFALEQNEKLWAGINLQKSLSKDKKWHYLLYTQTRLINKSHPWQTTLFEGGIGYSWYSDKTIWAGIRWGANNPNNGFYQQNRLFQQLVWVVEYVDRYKWISRSRLEETKYSNENQLSYQLRERLTLDIMHHRMKYVDPVVYDEVFLQLNKTDYTTNRLISQNRLFIGFNLYTSKITLWEIGYINQYQASSPINNQNQMNHIASITYNFI